MNTSTHRKAENWVFSGTVHPERAAFSYDRPINLTVANSDIGITIDLTVNIFANKVSILVASDCCFSDIHTVRNIVSDAANHVVEITGMVTAMAHAVEITSAIDINSGNGITFGIDMPAALTTQAIPDLAKIAHLSGANAFVRHAIADLINAMRRPADTGFLCYRAFESILQDIRHLNECDKKKAILMLKEKLGVRDSDMDFLREISNDSRHGKPVWISGDDRIRAIKVTRSLILAYIEGLSSGVWGPWPQAGVGGSPQ